jgi:hypothetical protein
VVKGGAKMDAEYVNKLYISYNIDNDEYILSFLSEVTDLDVDKGTAIGVHTALKGKFIMNQVFFDTLYDKLKKIVDKKNADETAPEIIVANKNYFK